MKGSGSGLPLDRPTTKQSPLTTDGNHKECLVSLDSLCIAYLGIYSGFPVASKACMPRL